MKIFTETSRLILRELVATDDKGMFELDSDAEVLKHLYTQPLTKIEQSQNVIAFIRKQYEENGIGRWAVIEKQSGDFIGWAGLKLVKQTINNHTNYYDVGYRLIPRYWGKGYATEVSKASVDYGFTILKLDLICATASMHNLASRKVLEKTGLTFKEEFLYDGQPEAWYEIRK
ncbi:MAG TPA: GNAT family N-acetyltransferase [Bacteroidia bacterium]|jgi:ribosomal-protein-alanine N-acetyltransferase|nr:GNAT family N-acetyltransferase [Bacteroidia bacterium]